MNQCVNMTSDAPRELSLCEINYVSGAGPSMSDFVTIGGGAGSAAGMVLARNILRGAAMGGGVGAGVGFLIGAGWLLADWMLKKPVAGTP